MGGRAHASARLFVAVDPPARVCRELASWARTFAASALAAAPRGRGARGRRGTQSQRPELRVLPPEGLHITLCFLGSRPLEEIDVLAGAVATCAGEVGELSVGAPLWLPPRRPRALAVEIHDPGGGLERLQRELTAALAGAVDWQPERRRFRAHLTLARIRGREMPLPAAAAEQPGPVTPALRFTPGSFSLYRSFLHPEGAAYEALATRELAPHAP